MFTIEIDFLLLGNFNCQKQRILMAAIIFNYCDFGKVINSIYSFTIIGNRDWRWKLKYLSDTYILKGGEHFNS